MSCLLWEGEFYESGESIAKRICEAIKLTKPEKVAAIAVEAREKMKLRHVPLLIVREMARLATHKHLVSETLSKVIQRPDELSEFCAIWQKDDKRPLSKTLSAQAKKGLAKAFTKFNAYSLAKYNRDGAILLRDVLFLCHAKTSSQQQAEDFKQLVDGTLPIPDTWEVELSKGSDKKESWTRLLSESKLGALALLRNLRNMEQAGVDRALQKNALHRMKSERVLPFRFISAARHAPYLEPELESSMLKCLEGREKLSGKTVLLMDISGSMNQALSSKSDLRRVDAAAALGILLRELCDDFIPITFSEQVVQCPPRRGFSLRDAMLQSQQHGGTYLGKAVATVAARIQFDRLIVISDEQSHDPVPELKGKKCYMLNVASSQNGVGYGAWNHIDGFSEACVDYIIALENAEKD